MVVVKILGAIDFASAIAFLMLIFGLDVNMRFLIFCAGLLLAKGLFIFTGEVPLSIIDIFSGIILIISIFTPVTVILLWIPAFLLLAKSVVSFL